MQLQFACGNDAGAHASAALACGRGIAQFAKGQVAFSQGDPADSVFYIQKGKFKLTVLSERGKEAVVSILGPGDFFGEACMVGQMRRLMSVIDSGRVDLSGMVTHRFRLDDIEKAYELFGHQRDGVLKVAITP